MAIQRQLGNAMLSIVLADIRPDPIQASNRSSKWDYSHDGTGSRALRNRLRPFSTVFKAGSQETDSPQLPAELGRAQNQDIRQDSRHQLGKFSSHISSSRSFQVSAFLQSACVQ